jgi:hypothetical protein
MIKTNVFFDLTDVQVQQAELAGVTMRVLEFEIPKDTNNGGPRTTTPPANNGNDGNDGNDDDGNNDDDDGGSRRPVVVNHSQVSRSNTVTQ